MPAENGADPGARRLSSWKEIAAFVGRDERTVKRWEETRGLPVRRMPGAGKPAVFAYAEEIERWIRSNVPTAATSLPPAPDTPVPLRRTGWLKTALLACAAAALIAVAAVAMEWQETPPGRLQGGARRYVPDSASAELYSAGLRSWQTRSPSGLARAVTDFNKAIRRDPQYAAAYAGLAGAYDLEGEFTATRPNRAYPAAAAAARRAIALDPKLASAHAALAFADFYWSRDANAAQREFRYSLALNPRSATAHHWYATFLMALGDTGRALAEIDSAESIDSESAAIPADKGLILYHAGQTGRAVNLLTQVEEDHPNFASPHRYLAMIWLTMGENSSFLRETRLGALSRHDTLGVQLADAGAQGLTHGGRAAMLRAILNAQMKFFAADKIPAYAIADTYGALGDRERAMKYIAISVARHEADNIALKVDICFSAFRSDPRFARLLVDAGLAPI
ncbi:MAG: hypothetical protein ACREHF_07480 [Rhizomicrobium sp.]